MKDNLFKIDIVMKDNDREGELYEILNNLWDNEDIEGFTIHAVNGSYGKGGDWLFILTWIGKLLYGDKYDELMKKTNKTKRRR